MNSPQVFQGIAGRTGEIAGLFDAVFTASEGAAEGALIAKLVRTLAETTPPDDLYCFRCEADKALVAAIFFTRLRYEDDKRRVFLLSPVAVATAHQAKGLGTILIRAGLDQLRNDGIELAVTYGDPAYYGRFGFQPVPEAQISAPQPLSQPQGWQAVSLTGNALPTLPGPVKAAPAFDRPELW